jgi:hypothetical protein
MATAAALLDTLPAPSTDWVDRVYLQLKDIHGVAAKQQAEISLQWQTEVFVLSPGRSKASRQGTASKLPTVGTTSSSVQAPTHDEDINTSATIIPSIEILSPIT